VREAITAVVCIALARLQDKDERWDIRKVNNSTAIAISFGLENTGLQDANECWDI
jgi:hypothetical protein